MFPAATSLTRYNTLQHAHCYNHAATHCNSWGLAGDVSCCKLAHALQHTATRTLQHAHRNTHSETHCNSGRLAGDVSCCKLAHELYAPIAVFQSLHKGLSSRLQHTTIPIATHCSTLQHTATHCHSFSSQRSILSPATHSATHCNTLQYTRCNTHTVTNCNSLQYTAAHCNSLQLTATHCNTLQHTATHYRCTLSPCLCIVTCASLRQSLGHP